MGSHSKSSIRTRIPRVGQCSRTRLQRTLEEGVSQWTFPLTKTPTWASVSGFSWTPERAMFFANSWNGDMKFSKSYLHKGSGRVVLEVDVDFAVVKNGKEKYQSDTCSNGSTLWSSCGSLSSLRRKLATVSCKLWNSEFSQSLQVCIARDAHAVTNSFQFECLFKIG